MISQQHAAVFIAGVYPAFEHDDASMIGSQLDSEFCAFNTCVYKGRFNFERYRRSGNDMDNAFDQFGQRRDFIVFSSGNRDCGALSQAHDAVVV